MKSITLPESYISLKHLANKEHRQKRCFYMIKSLNASKQELGNQLSNHIIEADKFTSLSEFHRLEASRVAQTMKRYTNRINKLTNYYNSLITI